jgi:hypothetical protein
LRDLEPSRQGEEGGEPGGAHLRLISLLTLLGRLRVLRRQRGGEREGELDADLSLFRGQGCKGKKATDGKKILYLDL